MCSNLQTSNYILITSNVISNRISGLNNISLATIGNIANASNFNTSNYVLGVDAALRNTSNVISNRITNLPLTKWVDNTTYLSYGNVNVYDEKITTGYSSILTKYPRETMTTAEKTYTDGTIVRVTETSYFGTRRAWTLFDGTKYVDNEQYTSFIKYNTSGDIGLINTAQSSQYLYTQVLSNTIHQEILD